MLTPFICGNWKMNGSAEAGATWIADVAMGMPDGVQLGVCPPAILVGGMAAVAAGTPVGVGGQDCHASETGAHTGDIAAEMLAAAGAGHIIVGHSERRADHGESDSVVAAKASAVWRAGLVPIICVGETLEERDAGKAEEIVGGQLDGSLPKDAKAESLVIAYEPVWAIGTGKVPTLEDIAAMHDFIRGKLTARFGDAGNDIVIQYGGSVKPDNAAEILAVSNVNGALVGGASLKAEDFLAIARAAVS